MNFIKKPLGKAENLQGQIFGYLEVLYRTENIGKHTAWCCKCLRDNNIVAVRLDHLKEGRVKSCGCYNAELSSERMKNINIKGKNAKDITGLRSGFLEAIEPTEKRISYGPNQSKVVWRCKCLNPIRQEPMYCEATTTALTSGMKKSCGCIVSVGEEVIKQILLNNNIPFTQQKIFETCIFPNTGYNGYFDFYVGNKYLIEFDGKQHYLPNCGWGEDFSLQQFKDEYKNQWCKENNIPLIRIPYTHLNQITIEDLKLETSQFTIGDRNE